MSDRYEAITGAGGRLAAITVDDHPRNAAMVEKLSLTFPILSDPDRSGAITPYGVADPVDDRSIAIPSIFVVAPDREVVFSALSRDFADRASEEAAVAALVDLGLPATTPESIAVNEAEPGPSAMTVHAMEPYFRGAKFAVTAMKRRHPQLDDDATEYIAQMDRYVELVRRLRRE